MAIQAIWGRTIGRLANEKVQEKTFLGATTTEPKAIALICALAFLAGLASAIFIAGSDSSLNGPLWQDTEQRARAMGYHERLANER